MKSTTLTLRIPLEMKDHLDQLAEATQRSRSSLGCEAIRRYLDFESRQVAKTRQVSISTGWDDFAIGAKFGAAAKKRSG